MGTVLELVEMNYILSLRRERSGAKMKCTDQAAMQEKRKLE